MKTDKRISPFPSGTCLTPEEFYRYVAQPEGWARHGDAERHISECPRCRRELASLIELLYPETADPQIGELSEAEMQQAMSIVQNVQASHPRPRTWRVRWPLAAAA